MIKAISAESESGLRRLLLLTALLAAIAGWVVAAPQSAQASNFCTNVFLAPYGQGGDRCFSNLAQTASAGVVTHERAGCVDFADGSNNLLRSWVCGAAGSGGGFAVLIYNGDTNIWIKSVIRNNNLSYGAHFDGGRTCYNGTC